jgi:hypothetical protein
LKWDSLHYFQIYITVRTHIFQKLAIGHKRSSYWLTFSHSKLLQYIANLLALVQINYLVLLNIFYLYPQVILDFT